MFCSVKIHGQMLSSIVILAHNNSHQRPGFFFFFFNFNYSNIFLRTWD